MTDKTDNKKSISVENGTDCAADDVVRNRRALLKSAMVTMPMILTLQSGAALARSSNIISASEPANALDLEGRMLCLDLRSADKVQTQGKWADMGDSDPVITAIPQGTYYVAEGGEETSRAMMCREGDVGFWTQPVAGVWEPTDTVPKGILVSAIALSSFAVSRITEI
jgi:hypothetical protein